MSFIHIAKRDHRTIHLVFGFIRETQYFWKENNLNLMQIFPESICEFICCLVYFKPIIFFASNRIFNHDLRLISDWYYISSHVWELNIEHQITQIHPGSGFCLYYDGINYFFVGSKEYVKFDENNEDDNIHNINNKDESNLSTDLIPIKQSSGSNELLLTNNDLYLDLCEAKDSDHDDISFPFGSKKPIQFKEYWRGILDGLQHRHNVIMNDDVDKDNKYEVIRKFTKIYPHKNNTMQLITNIFTNPWSETVYFMDIEGDIYGNGKCINKCYRKNDYNKYKSNTIKINELSNCNIKTIKSGSTYSVALSNNGNVYSYGYDPDGYGGHTHYIYGVQFKFQQIYELKDHYIDQIECGINHTLFLENTGSVWSVGSNLYGECGFNNSFIRILDPTIIKSFNDENIIIKDIKCGRNHNLSIDINHKIYSFGNNENGQCGHGYYAAETIFIPLIIETLKYENTISIKCGSLYSYAKTDSNKHYLFG
eukprot:278020_1